MEDEDDSLYNKNLTNGIKMGLDSERQLDNDMKVDDFEYPLKEGLLSVCSLDDECAYRFLEFCAVSNMSNP